MYTSKKLVTRLNRLTEALEARGIGSWCDCPHPDGINAGLIVASQLNVELDIEPIVTCSNHHKPRPLRAEGDLDFIWLHLLPELAEEFEREIVSAGKTAFSGNGRLKPSRFVMADYG